jgi:hypothetical protein
MMILERMTRSLCRSDATSGASGKPATTLLLKKRPVMNLRAGDAILGVWQIHHRRLTP